jgi:hypothetical protein
VRRKGSSQDKSRRRKKRGLTKPKGRELAVVPKTIERNNDPDSPLDSRLLSAKLGILLL